MTGFEDYDEYHRAVVEACVELYGDDREYYEELDFEDEFEEGISPKEVADSLGDCA